MDNNKTVIFYAPTGLNTKGFKIGGAEAGCRKTLEIMKAAGFHVILLEKPVKKSEKKIDSFFFIFVLVHTWLKLIGILIRNKKSVFHIAGFYLNQIYAENLFISSAKLLGVKTIYEIRNGGMIEAYEEGNSIYRFFMRSTLDRSNRIFCQGYDYIPFIQKTLHKESVYYPNYIMDKYIVKDSAERSKRSEINLVYLGRVVADKNIEFIIDICNELHKSNLNFSLKIIGGYDDEYFNILSKRIQSYTLSKQQVSFLGRLESDEIFSILREQHFFLFPSKEKREGHSNALTETMGCGVVPVVSNAGFNASVVNNPLLVIPEFDSTKYANRIVEIWKNGQWLELSNEVKHRVLNNYIESIVKKAFLSTYANLFNNAKN